MRATRIASVLVAVAFGTAAGAEETAQQPNPFANIKFQQGPVKGQLEDIATIDIPEGFAFIGGRKETAKFIEATQNLVNNQEIGVVLPAIEGESWWLLFDFDPVGYVKDDEKDSLDADKLLEAIKEGTERGNVERKRRGWSEFHVTGWHTPPKYDAATHNLEWATRLADKDGASINYQVRLLGRRGVVSATLIDSPEKIDAALPKLRTLLAAFAYTQEQSYASYKPGDKVAEYGLTALVAGGALAVAAKSGLLGKLWKVLAAGVIAVAAGIRKIFGRKKPDAPSA